MLDGCAARPGTASKGRIDGDVRFDRFTRGRYATDASHYQITPVGVVAPRTMDEAERAIGIAAGRGRHGAGRAAAAPRNAGRPSANRWSSTARNTSTESSISTSQNARCVVEPGIVLDDLNRQLQAAWAVVSGRYLDRVARHHRRHGRQQFLRRPFAALRHHARQCASRSMRCWPTARKAHFGPMRRRACTTCRRHLRPLARDLLAHRRARSRRDRRALPEGAAPRRRLQSRCAGAAASNDINLAHILVGSRRHARLLHPQVELKLSPLLGRRAVGACHFGSFYEAMDCAQHIVRAEADRGRAGRPHHDRAGREIAMFQPTLEPFVRGRPERSCWSSSARTIRTKTCAACNSSAN